MAGAFSNLLSSSGSGGASDLEAQIKAKWGGYGDWNAAGQNHYAEFAKLLRAKGITDLSQLEFKTRDVPGAARDRDAPAPSTYEGYYGGKQLDYLGDLDQEGNVTPFERGPQMYGGYDPETGQQVYHDNSIGFRDDSRSVLGWSGAGHGSTSYTLQRGPNGQIGVAPTWNSSRQETLNNVRDGALVIGAGATAAYGLGAAGYGSGLGTGAATGAGAGAAGYSAADLAAFSPEFSQGAYVGANGGLATGAGAGAGVNLGSTSGADLSTFYGGEGMGTSGYTAATPSLASAPSSASPSFLDTIANGAKSGLSALGINGGDLLRVGAAYGLSKNVKAPQADPNLAAAQNGMLDVYKEAGQRAKDSDEYWRTTFAPRYLNAMDQQLATGKQLTDFNMGLARKYDDRYWNTTAKQQDKFYDQVDAYDNSGARERMAGQAGATAEQQNSAAMEQMMRNLSRRGINPNSGQWLSNMRQAGQGGALAKATAINMTREAARKEGLNMRAVAAGLGGNLTGASAQFSGLTGSSSGLGMAGIQGAQAGSNANNANWNSTMGLGAGALGNLGQLGMGMTNMGFQANQMNTLGWNQMLGGSLGLFGGSKT